MYPMKLMGVIDLNSYSGGLIGLISSAGPVAKAVVFILLFFSVFSWAIFLFKWKQLSDVENDGEKFLKVARDGGVLQEAHHHVCRQS